MYLNIVCNEKNSQKYFTLYIHEVHKWIYILYRLHLLYILRYLLNLLIACLTSYCHARVSCSLPTFLQRQLDSPPCGLLLYGLGLCRLCWPQKEEIPKKYRNKYRRYSTCCGFVCVLLLFILLCIYFYCLFVDAPPPSLSLSLSLSLSFSPEIVSIALQTIAQRTKTDRNRQVTARRATKCI